MPKPLPPNIDVYVERKCLPGNYAMPAMEVSLDHYSIAYHVSGDRKWFSYDKVEIMHPGDIGLGMIHVYHRNLPMSDAPYDRYLIKFRKEALQSAIDLIGEQVFERMYFNHICRFTKETQAKIHRLFQEMLEEYERNSPSEYITNARLQQAQILLGKTDLSIERIAEKVGFANGNYFCNVFKKRYGVAPSEFRRSAKE